MMEREQTTIRLPAGLKEKLQQEAQERGVSWNSLVLKILNAEMCLMISCSISLFAERPLYSAIYFNLFMISVGMRNA